MPKKVKKNLTEKQPNNKVSVNSILAKMYQIFYSYLGISFLFFYFYI